MVMGDKAGLMEAYIEVDGIKDWHQGKGSITSRMVANILASGIKACAMVKV